MCSGGAKMVLGEAAAYAASRRQFNQPIANFGAIKHKLGEMTARVYGVESALYRTTGLIDGALNEGLDLPGVLEEFAIEASILKVAASEMLDYVLDENVQIHGGNGFVKDYPAERYYRDARVNRIFEGTNEINRLLVPGMLARRAVKGTLPLLAAAQALQEELLLPPSLPSSSSEWLSGERAVVAGMKKVALAVLGTAMQTFTTSLPDQQEVLSFTSDILMDAFIAESSLHRARQAMAEDSARSSLHEAAARIVVHTAVHRVDASSREAFAAMAKGDMLRTLLAAQKRWLKVTAANLVAARRVVADDLVQRRRYSFEQTRSLGVPRGLRRALS
jgi:Acyl-CoA dehydrogenase, C-terminal domain